MMKRFLVSTVACLAIVSALAQGVAPLITASQLASGAAVGNIGFTPMNGANNLAEIITPANARTNLGLGGLATVTPGTNVAAGAAVATNGASGFVQANGSGYVPYLQHVGPATNATNAAGNIGEFITSGYVSGVSMGSGTPLTVTSIALTAGNWEIWGSVVIVPAGTTVLTTVVGVVSATTNVATPISQDVHLLAPGFTPAGDSYAAPVGRTRISIAAGATYYLVVNATFTTSTLTAGGIISAVRTY